MALPRVREKRRSAPREDDFYPHRLRLHDVPHDTCRMTLVPCVNLGGDHCDFCQSSPVFTVYPCSNFLVNGLPVFPGRTTGSWATCRKCTELVDQERWSDLTERAYRKFAKRHGASRHEM